MRIETAEKASRLLNQLREIKDMKVRIQKAYDTKDHEKLGEIAIYLADELYKELENEIKSL